MRIGCGLRVHRIDGNEYLYFWHYEREGGRSRRREDYVGPARDPTSRQNGGRKLLAYYRRIQADVASRIARLERSGQAIRTVSIAHRFLPLNRGRFEKRPRTVGAGLPISGSRTSAGRHGPPGNPA